MTVFFCHNMLCEKEELRSEEKEKKEEKIIQKYAL